MKLTNIKLDGHIWFMGNNYDGTPWLSFFQEGPDGCFVDSGYIKLAPYTIEIELPEGIDLYKAKLESLQHKRKLILAENQQRINQVDEEIQNYLAIEYKAND